jgi:N4-gp56 family major capsid protein
MFDNLFRFYSMMAMAPMADAGTNVNTTYGNANAYTGSTTTTTEMSPGMKTFYNTDMLENMRPRLVFGQFGKKQTLPARHGMTMEWRKWKTFGMIGKLVEGVIPTGKTFGQTAVTASIAQYGDYVTISDLLDLHHVDPVIQGAEVELSAAAAKTIDTLQRDGILAGATNIAFADAINTATGAYVSTPDAVYALSNASGSFSLLTPDMVAQAKTIMENNNVPKINGKWYVAVIHPYAAYDLMRNPEWTDYHKYEATEEIFAGELGELYGIRFVQSTNAPIMVGDPLYSATQRYLTCASSGYSTLGSAGTISAGNGYGVGTKFRFTVTETLSSGTADYEKLIGQYILFEDGGTIDDRLVIAGIDVANGYVYTETAPTDGSATTGDYLLPGNGGAEHQATNKPVAVFATIFFGNDAYGIIDPAGGNLRMIIKDRGSIGGPLEQFSTCGCVFEHGTKILYEERVLVMYHTGKYSAIAQGNWRM